MPAGVEREPLDVAGQQQPRPARPQHDMLLPVDLDPCGALVDDDELHVDLAARAEAPARPVDDLPDAQSDRANINLGQHEAHCGHWQADVEP